MRIVTWNLLAPEFARPGKDGRDYYARTRTHLPWDRRRVLIIDRLRELDGDLLLLQEVSKVHWHRGLEQALSAAGYRCLLAPRPEGRADGVVLAARSSMTIDASETVAFDDGTDKVGLIARLTVAGRSLTVASVHLKWSETDDVPVRQLRMLMERIGTRGLLPAVVAGDLNFDIVASPVWSELSRAGWTSCYADDASPTWAADGRARKLDAILVRGFELRSVRPLPVINVEVGLPSDIEPSDHLPLVAVLEFTTPSTDARRVPVGAAPSP